MAREQAECLLQQRYQVAIMQYQVLSDCGRYFWQTPKAWEAVDPQRVTQVGAGAAGAEHPHDPRYSALGGAAANGTSVIHNNRTLSNK
jgi:hypothetical protein